VQFVIESIRNSPKVIEVTYLVRRKQAWIKVENLLLNSMVNKDFALKLRIGIEECISVVTATSASIVNEEAGLADEVVVVLGERLRLPCVSSAQISSACYFWRRKLLSLSSFQASISAKSQCLVPALRSRSKTRSDTTKYAPFDVV
jgi:hypothetical protein